MIKKLFLEQLAQFLFSDFETATLNSGSQKISLKSIVACNEGASFIQATKAEAIK